MRFWVERARAAAIGTTASSSRRRPACCRLPQAPNSVPTLFPLGSVREPPRLPVYEMVSPLENEDGNVYVPDPGTVPEGDAISTPRPIRASADGDAVPTWAIPPPKATATSGFDGQQLSGYARPGGRLERA